MNGDACTSLINRSSHATINTPHNHLPQTHTLSFFLYRVFISSIVCVFSLSPLQPTMENPSNKGNTSSSSARRSPSSSPLRPLSPTNEPQTAVDAVDPSSMAQNYGVAGFNSGGVEGGEPPLPKTPEEVLADLTTSDNSGGSPPPPPPPPPPEGQSGGSLGMMGGAMAIAVGGGGVVIGDVGPAGGADGDIGAVKKRKASDIKDPPTGTPTCPVCKKTFSSWKGAFGHMRKHPERHYRGFFQPPTFSSSSSNPAAGGSQAAGEGGSGGGQGTSGEGRGQSSPVRGLVFDLNQPMEGAADPAEEGNADEGNKIGFDLNEFPADEDKP